ncbi:MAG: cell division protein FtsW [Alphaproteobacteria bacterium]|nr:cell division protein FtsW [Alphaproteobacteria bacterium]
MSAIARTDTSVLGRWWWTVDRWTLVALGALIFCGIILAMAASPGVAARIGAEPYHFVKRQMMILPVAVMLLFACSLATPRQIVRLSVIGLAIFAGLTALTFIGPEIKGARRWVMLPGFQLQPSEFVKPFFAVVAAWLFAAQKINGRFPGYVAAIVLYLAIVAMLVKQPDLGMAVVVSAVWFTQFFLAGLPLWLVGTLGIAGFAGLFGAYLWLPHVTSRINRFLDPGSGDSYQVDRAMEAFLNGGLFGRGPGEGIVKRSIPDAHADFIFAVAGEEFGLIACLLIVALFAFVVLRGFGRALQETNLFVLLASTGLFVQFGLQAIINMGSSLHLMPTKGMTLPFISYGGSSLLALAVGMGMALALTRKRYGLEAMP